MTPDLRSSAIPLVDQLFDQVVRKGSKVDRGMPAYASLSDDQLKALQHYIRSRARSTIPAKETSQ